ncbi:MAG TPA: hypothetical protein VJ376_18960, partial [Pseudomonadota bacterium]|nr:hypothetical protein [Pseudomonadota bacterium]
LSGARRLTIQSFIDGPVGFDFLKCQTFAASPAEPGELLFWFSERQRNTSAAHLRRFDSHCVFLTLERNTIQWLMISC